MKGRARLLKIYISETDMLGKKSLYEEIVMEARNFGLAGATVHRGILAFGASHSIHSVNRMFTGNQVPIVVEIVDEAEKIEAFVGVVHRLIEESEKGALVTLQDVEVLEYRRGKNYNPFTNF